MMCTITAPEVHEYPFGRSLALDAADLGALRLQLLLHVARHRRRLARRIGGRDDDLVEERRHLAHVEHDDVAALDVFQRSNGGFNQFVQSHRM